MNLDQYQKYEDKLFNVELKRLTSLGYDPIDAHELALNGINAKITNLLLLELFLKEQKK